MTPERLAVAAAAVTVETFCTRWTALAGKVGFCEPNDAAGLGDDQVGAELGQLGLEGALGALGQPDGADHGGDADDRAEHDHERPHLAGLEAGPRHVREIAATGSRRHPLQPLVGDDLRRRASTSSGRPVLATVRSWVTITTARSGDCRPAEDVEHVGGVRRVEGPGRLVGEDHEGVGHDGAGQRHPLLLAAGHLHRSVVGPGAEAEAFEGARAPVPAAPSAGCRGRGARSPHCRARSGGG